MSDFQNDELLLQRKGSGSVMSESKPESSAPANLMAYNKVSKDGTTTPSGSSLSSSFVATAEDSIKVIVRLRPQNDKESVIHNNGKEAVQIHDSGLISVHDPNKGEPFVVNVNCALGPDSSQEQVFWEAGSSIVDHCMAGFNSSIFAYGQTGSGKTYTMLGCTDRQADGSLSNGCGLAPRIFETLFQAITQHEESCHGRRKNKNNNSSVRYSVKCSFLEIYNEEITDLLRPEAVGLQIRDGDLKRGVYVQGLSETEVLNADDVLKLMEVGSENRRQASTLMNERSSRSHSVLTATIEARERAPSGAVNARFSKLNLIDLAGSERVGRSGVTGEQLTEARSINRSLTVLGRVIAALGDRSKKPNIHVPYRDSRLTFLLRESLGGNSRTCIIATVTPACESLQETCSTLAFASGAKKVRCRPIVNEDCIGDTRSLQQEILRLQKIIEELESRPTETEIIELRQKLEQAEALFDQNNAAITSLRAETDVIRQELSFSKMNAQRLAEEAAQLRSDNSSLQRTVQVTESEKQNLLQEINDAHQSIENLKTGNAELVKLREDLHEARKSAAKIASEASEAQARCKTTEALLEETRTEVRRLRKEAKEESIATRRRELDLHHELEAAKQTNRELESELEELKIQVEKESASVWKYRRMLKEISHLVDWAQMGSRPHSALKIDLAANSDKENGIASSEPSPGAQSALQAARKNFNPSKILVSKLSDKLSQQYSIPDDGSPPLAAVHDLRKIHSSSETTLRFNS